MRTKRGNVTAGRDGPDEAGRLSGYVGNQRRTPWGEPQQGASLTEDRILSFSPEIAELRFGCGLSPRHAPPRDIDAVLAGLDGPDVMVSRFPVLTWADHTARVVRVRELGRQRRKAKSDAVANALGKKIKAERLAAGQDMVLGMRQNVVRWAETETGFRERLVRFWADHFTVVGKSGLSVGAVSTYVDDAIRPHVAGRFEDMLIAAETHPLMLIYLDQHNSVGPDSRYATRRAGKNAPGLNENLAREVMELHTLGVDGPYTQQDVRQMAELFAGMGITIDSNFVFRPERAEPGVETVLGQGYGAGGDFDDILQVLRDLAAHPATARHIARKLAVHFVSDTPDQGLVDHIAARFEATGGDLRQGYAAMLEHPAAWASGLGNVKPAFDFLASSGRALGVTADRLETMPVPRFEVLFRRPQRLMGQTWQKPIGPDGWSEEDAELAVPQVLAARVRWAMKAPRQLRPDLPDPRRFVTDALGAQAPEPVVFAARAAETRTEAIGLVLCSPAFQRR